MEASQWTNSELSNPLPSPSRKRKCYICWLAGTRGPPLKNVQPWAGGRAGEREECRVGVAWGLTRRNNGEKMIANIANATARTVRRDTTAGQGREGRAIAKCLSSRRTRRDVRPTIPPLAARTTLRLLAPVQCLPCQPTSVGLLKIGSRSCEAWVSVDSGA